MTPKDFVLSPSFFYLVLGKETQRDSQYYCIRNSTLILSHHNVVAYLLTGFRNNFGPESEDCDFLNRPVLPLFCLRPYS